MALDAIIDDYIRRYRAYARADVGEFRKLSSLREAIQHASLCHWLPSHKRHPHQYRIPKSVLQAAERALQGAQHRIAHAENFDALYSEIEHTIGRLHGVGALTIYDIAHRIGAYLRKRPKLVYLHRGTRIGARLLGFTGTVLDPRSLPSAFRSLTPEEIEDCLCIYKDEFLPGRSLSRFSRPPRVCVDRPARLIRKC